MSTSLEAGQTIDRFELVALCGRGGMGEVWEAIDAESGERVALKLIKDASTSPQLRRRFAREVRAASSVEHPAVVKVHDVITTDDDLPVMVMELLEGESLAERLAREPELPVETVAAIMLPVVSAVGSAHAAGIIHRDLKPENIFLVRNDDGSLAVRVLDFGIAKLAADEAQGETTAGLTTTGSILGTPCYMAPEQVFGEKDVDHRVDIWAMGIILYQMLTGILPTRADNVGQVLKIIVTRGIWPLAEAAPDLPEELSEMVDRMLARERDDRPEDLRDVQAVLERFAEEEVPSFGPPTSERAEVEASSERRSTPAPVGGGTTIDPLADTALGPALEKPPMQRRSWLWLAVPLVAVLGWAGVELSNATPAGGDATGPDPAAERDATGESVAAADDVGDEALADRQDDGDGEDAEESAPEESEESEENEESEESEESAPPEGTAQPSDEPRAKPTAAPVGVAPRPVPVRQPPPAPKEDEGALPEKAPPPPAPTSAGLPGGLAPPPPD